MKITIIPYEGVNPADLKQAGSRLREVYQAEVELGKKLKVPACRKRGNQLHGEDFIYDLQKRVKEGYVLGVVDADLYVPELNFVFGLAFMSYCVIGLPRLKTENQELYTSRIAKEAVHEVGHLMGLEHCPNRKCVMHFSNTLMDTDVKKETPCSSCKNTLEEKF